MKQERVLGKLIGSLAEARVKRSTTIQRMAQAVKRYKKGESVNELWASILQKEANNTIYGSRLLKEGMATLSNFEDVWVKRRRSLRYMGTIASMVGGCWKSGRDLAKARLIPYEYVKKCPLCQQESEYGEDLVHYLLECPRWEGNVKRDSVRRGLIRSLKHLVSRGMLKWSVNDECMTVGSNVSAMVDSDSVEAKRQSNDPPSIITPTVSGANSGIADDNIYTRRNTHTLTRTRQQQPTNSGTDGQVATRTQHDEATESAPGHTQLGAFVEDNWVTLLEGGTWNLNWVPSQVRWRVGALAVGAYMQDSSESWLTHPLGRRRVERRAVKMVRRVVEFVATTAKDRVPVLELLRDLVKVENETASGIG